MTTPLLASGDARVVAGTSPRLVARTVPAGALDRATLDAAFALFAAAYDGADRIRFERDLAEKQRIILMRDASSGALKGFSTVLIQPAPNGGTVLFSGDTVIDPAYWGQKQLQIAFARLLLSLRAQSPRRPLYWFLISKGYRTYLLLANHFPVAIPRHDREDDPELGPLLERIAVARYGDQFDPRTRIIRFTAPHDRVRDGVAPVTERHLRIPHVRFFVDRNPGHAAGDELACLAKIRVRDVLVAVARIALARVLRLAGPGVSR